MTWSFSVRGRNNGTLQSAFAAEIERLRGSPDDPIPYAIEGAASKLAECFDPDKEITIYSHGYFNPDGSGMVNVRASLAPPEVA